MAIKVDPLYNDICYLERRRSRETRSNCPCYTRESPKAEEGTGLDNLDFAGKQELLRLLVEKVLYGGQGVEIQTIIPLGEQLHPIHRGG